MVSAVRFLRPRSFLSLVLVGFVAVALPLLATIVAASLQVDRLARQSEDTVYRTVRLTHGGRSLVDHLTNMERSVRQHLILKDDSLLAAYDTGHAEFQGTVTYMLALEEEPEKLRVLRELAERERSLFARVRGEEVDPAGSEQTLAEFAELTDLAKTILAEASVAVGHHVEVLREMAGTASAGCSGRPSPRSRWWWCWWWCS
jgi:two-component system sensor histidine kinase GlrK